MEELMAGGVENMASGVVTIDALLGNLKWSSLNLTYNFPDSVAYYDPATYFSAGTTPSPPTFDFASFAPAPVSLQNAITHAITTQLEAVAPLNYTLTTPGDAAADSSFARADLFNDPELAAPPGGIGYYPGIVDRGGDAWFNVNQNRFNDVDIGDSAYWVVLHELGHTIGLKHGHANDRPGPTTDTLPDELNSMEFSVMTYHRYVGDAAPFNDTEEGSFAQSLMMLDIAAIQYMYGANYNTNAGNTVYTFSTTTGEMFVDGVGQGTPEINRIFRTIWDGNGVDTYDLSNYTTDLQIDLAPGGWSVFDTDQLALLNETGNIHARGNVFNALLFEDDPRSLIENAIGGSGDDTIKGNVAANVLTGNGGNDHLLGFDGADTLSGGGGNDILDGGAGRDALNGGGGFDFASYETAAAGVSAALILPLINSGDAAGDKYSSIEGLIGSAFDDCLVGNTSANELRGGAGDDTLTGLLGNDRLDGGTGDDFLLGGLGNDTLVFGEDFGHDTIVDWQDGSILGNDVISFAGLGLSLGDLTINYGFLGATIGVNGTDDEIFVLGAHRNSLTAEDFLF
jgi:serralysin